MRELTFDVGLAYKIKKALVRNNISDVADLDWLASGNNIAMVRKFRLEQEEISTKSGQSNPTTVTLPAIENPRRLQNMYNVRLSENATKLFNSVKNLSVTSERTLEYCNLTRFLSHRNVIRGFGDKATVVFGSVEVLETVIGQLIIEQPQGRSGYLLNDGNTNIFYVQNPEKLTQYLSVILHWSIDFSEWSVHFFLVSDHEICNGSRVFSATVA